MNSRLFRAKMVEKGETSDSVAKYLNIARSTLYRKIRGVDTDFDQKEITALKNRWELSPEDVDRIFFTEKVS